jgi:hypothetical protein
MHTDIPIRTDIERLIAARDPSSVTMYLPTSPVARAAQEDRIVFKNLAAEAADRLRAGDAPRGEEAAIAEALEDLRDDDEFWALQANSLALFATPSRVGTYRLANRLTGAGAGLGPPARGGRRHADGGVAGGVHATARAGDADAEQLARHAGQRRVHGPRPTVGPVPVALVRLVDPPLHDLGRREAPRRDEGGAVVWLARDRHGREA